MYKDGLFYVRNHLQYTLLHKVSILLNHLSTGLQTLVISAWVFHGSKIFIIVPWVYQIQDISHLGIRVSRKKIARRHCHMLAILFLFLVSHHFGFLLHLNNIFSHIFPAFEYYFFPHLPSLVIKLCIYSDRTT